MSVIDQIKKLRITNGALVLVLISFLFTVTVYKVDSSNLNKSARISNSVCHTIAGFNASDQATKVRIEGAIVRDQKQAQAEQRIADVWKTALKPGTPPAQLKLIQKIVDAQETLAAQDRAAARDLESQLKGVAPIQLEGC